MSQEEADDLCKFLRRFRYFCQDDHLISCIEHLVKEKDGGLPMDFQERLKSPDSVTPIDITALQDYQCDLKTPWKRFQVILKKARVR